MMIEILPLLNDDGDDAEERVRGCEREGDTVLV